MRDPHAETLHYRLVTTERVTFNNAPPLLANRNGFGLALDAGELTVTLRDHHATEQAAREAVEPLLRAWEIHHALWAGSAEISFEFERSALVDRNPAPRKPGEPIIIEVESAGMALVGGSVSFVIGRGQYPEPPVDFAVDPDTETLWQRWLGYTEGREPLQAMAYFCKTVLEMHGGAAGAASRFGISGSILTTLGRLSTETGDPTTARKAGSKLRPLTDTERTWLEAAVKLLVRRAAEVAANPEAERVKLTMGDLPTL